GSETAAPVAAGGSLLGGTRAGAAIARGAAAGGVGVGAAGAVEPLAAAGLDPPPPPPPPPAPPETVPPGVTAFDCEDDGPVPAAFAAVMVKVYVEPFVRPATTIGLFDPVAVRPPGDEVTV